MTQEQMTILRPDEGMMLTNGETWSDFVYLGSLDSAANWQERPMAEYEAWQAEQEAAENDGN